VTVEGTGARGPFAGARAALRCPFFLLGRLVVAGCVPAGAPRDPPCARWRATCGGGCGALRWGRGVGAGSTVMVGSVSGAEVVGVVVVPASPACTPVAGTVAVDDPSPAADAWPGKARRPVVARSRVIVRLASIQAQLPSR
jgi:hypothetical protein